MLIEVNTLVLAKAREIKSVRTASVPGAKHNFILCPGSGEEIAIGVGVKTVGRITAAGGHVGTIEMLDGGNVI
ncbi:hypothetical protein D3C72_2277260 [compost metagenome]